MPRFLPAAAKSPRSAFFTYVLMMFFFTLGDATMSYIAPVVMEHQLGATKMGMILAASSMVGTVMDFTFARLFGRKKSVFFKKILLSLVLLFPLSFLIYQTIPSFLFGMLIWGIYFEAFVFANYHTIHETIQPHEHIWAWGMLTTVRNIGWVIGPLMASYLDGVNSRYPLFFAIAGFSIAIFLFFFQKRVHRTIHASPAKIRAERHGFFQELRIWKTYGRIFWPLLFLIFMVEIIDSTFFSIGPVFAENLHEIHPLGSLFIAMYTVPGLIFGALSGYVSRPFGKKRAAFGAGIVAGVGLMILSQVQSVELILGTTFFASMGIAIIYPEVAAVFEDYIARAKHSGNDIVGLSAIIASISYVVGPITNGYLSDRVGTQAVFGLWGSIIAIFSLIALLTVKRKLHLPQSKIAKLLVVKKKRRLQKMF